jgi:hypothetical protein
MIKQKSLFKTKLGFLAAIFLLGCLAPLPFTVQSQAQNGDIEITANFAEKEVASNEKIELRLNRSLQNDEGRIAVILNDTDLTALFVGETNSLSYKPKIFALPAGENKLRVYRVNGRGEWTLLKEFVLKVAETSESPTGESQMEFTPTLSVNFKGENNVSFFPETARPERLRFTDTAGQGGARIKVRRGGWTLGGQFDFAGSSRKREALRFGELGNRAPSIDLSSYQIQIEKGRFKANLGHVSYGSQRHLINSFSSRGLSVTVPVGKQNEVSFSLMNGTSIVGFDNFVGFTRANHQVLGVTFAREFIKTRPGGLRLEVSAMRGSLLPLNGFNERSVNDAEKSYGGAVRLLFKDKKERFRFEGGFTRSRFTNPRDPNLEQAQAVTPVNAVARNARFLEASFDFLQGLKLFDDRKLKITGTFRHEEIQPLFRSVALSTQADRRQNQFEIAASFGDISFTFGNLRDRDNLNDIPSILKTFSRRSNVIFSMSPGTLFNPAKPIKWLPRISYTYDHFHQFGAFLPANGEFNSLSQVPDQDTFTQTFNAELPVSDKFRVGYRYSRTFQDNRQPGRDLADFLSATNAFTIGFNPSKSVQMNFDLSQERQKNFETARIDRQFRLASNATWQNAILKNSTVNANLSTTLAGDAANTNDARNVEFDVQWSYKFSFGKEKFRKMESQFFLRYANRYGERTDRVFFLSDYNKFQGFNMGLSFNFF